MDIELLSLLSSRDKYTRFKPYITEAVLSKECRLIYNNLEAFYTAHPGCHTIVWPAYKTWFLLRKNSVLKDTNLESYHIIFDKLEKHKPDKADEDLLEYYITKDYMARIVQTAQKVRDGDEALKNMLELTDECVKTLKRAVDPSVLFASNDSSGVLAKAASGGFEWRLEELNISLGPLRQGDFVVLAARPETGKTTFCADQFGYMATQIGDKRPVIWVNNEEQSEKVALRVKQAQLGITFKDYLLDPKGWDAKYAALMHGDINRVLVLSNDSGCNNVSSLDAIFHEYNPALIIFDQLDKVRGFDHDEQEYQRLASLYNWARDLTHKYGPVVAVCQADGTAHNTRFIEMHQLAGSKTGKQGEADAIITIGKVEDVGMENQRFINVPKNKLSGGPKSDEKFRHGKWEVTIKPEIARYEGTH